MKKALKIFGYLLLALLLLVAGLAAYIQFAPEPTHKVQAPDLKITADSAHLAEGRRIALTVCAYCHRGPDGKLSGDVWSNDSPFGTIWTANLTQHPDAGVTSRYTDGELLYLLRTSVKRDGHSAGPFMAFPLMSDEDLSSVIAFLRSDAPEVQPSERNTPPRQLTFLGKMFMKMIAEPLPYPAHPLVAPDTADQLAWGRYLVTSKWICSDCHSTSFETYNALEPEKSPGYLAGGNPIEDKEKNTANSANLTPDTATGIGSWTEAQFAEAVRFGKRPDGRALSPMMPPMTILTDAEIAAIWAYLRSVPPINNPVDRTTTSR